MGRPRRAASHTRRARDALSAGRGHGAAPRCAGAVRAGETDKVTSIVKHTDARLLELQELMGPVQERAQSLSNAHKNLTAVRDETRTWLDHLEAMNEAEARGNSRSRMRIPTSPRDRKRSSGAGPSRAGGAILRRTEVVRRCRGGDGAAPARSFAGAFARANASSRSWSPRRTASGVSLPGARECPRRQKPDSDHGDAPLSARRDADPSAVRDGGVRDARVAREGEDRGFDASYHDSRSAETEARPPRRLAALARVLLTAPGDPNQSEGPRNAHSGVSRRRARAARWTRRRRRRRRDGGVRFGRLRFGGGRVGASARHRAPDSFDRGAQARAQARA